MNRESCRQFSSYLMVGGTAAVVEWASFFLLAKTLNVHYINATILAFVMATFSNWKLGRMTTFKNAKNNGSIVAEVGFVYAASGIGLLINLVIMYVFATVFQVELMASKVFGTGVVLIWNYTVRKKLIYKT